MVVPPLGLGIVRLFVCDTDAVALPRSTIYNYNIKQSDAQSVVASRLSFHQSAISRFTGVRVCYRSVLVMLLKSETPQVSAP